MTAYRVIDTHSELTDVSGTLSHAQIDARFASGSFVTVNDERSTLQSSRRLVAGSNVTIADDAVAGTVIISASGSGGGGSLPTPTMAGQFLVATSLSSFVPALVITSPTNGVLINDSGLVLVNDS